MAVKKKGKKKSRKSPKKVTGEKMIKLTDKNGEALNLLATRASDESHYATRSAIRKALDETVEYNGGGYSQITREPLVELQIRRNDRDDVTYTESLTVGVIFKRGILQFGCHTFNRATSKQIVQWAR
jgi:hypothetical protein